MARQNKKRKAKSTPGRKGKYDSNVKPYLEDITAMCRDGLTEEEICKKLGVGVSTFARYKLENEELREALKNGKRHADFKVEDALFKRATGFEHVEQTFEEFEMSREEYDFYVMLQLDEWVVKNPGHTKEERDAFIESIPRTKTKLTKTVRKMQPPDTTAAIFWLKNRRPDEWRDRQQVQHSGEITTTNKVDMSSLTAEELRNIAKNLADE